VIYRLIKAFLFLLPAETAHHLTTKSFSVLVNVPLLSQFIQSLFRLDDPSLKRELFGLTFSNPIGLAAGFDKDGKYIKAMSALGFGFIEVGTVTPRPQIGNPRPRLFRIIKDEAIINRMGFNNGGVIALKNRLKALGKRDIIIGGNIGKNKDTPNELAHEDYLFCFEQLYEYVDYFVVNLSSPNTPGLRSLQERRPLSLILSTLTNYRKNQAVSRPILLKIAPDLNDDLLKDVVDIALELSIDGIISTNTTIERQPLTENSSVVQNLGAGGLSGRPLRKRSNDITKKVFEYSRGKFPIIGVGGIYNTDTALERMESGASLLQLYTGFIYEGPYLIKRLKKALAKK